MSNTGYELFDRELFFMRYHSAKATAACGEDTQRRLGGGPAVPPLMTYALLLSKAIITHTYTCTHITN